MGLIPSSTRTSGSSTIVAIGWPRDVWVFGHNRLQDVPILAGLMCFSCSDRPAFSGLPRCNASGGTEILGRIQNRDSGRVVSVGLYDAAGSTVSGHTERWCSFHIDTWGQSQESGCSTFKSRFGKKLFLGVHLILTTTYARKCYVEIAHNICPVER